MSTVSLPFLNEITAATTEAARADRHRLAGLVAELAQGRKPSLAAPEVADLLARLNMPPESVSEMVTLRQRLDGLRLEAARGPELRDHARDVQQRTTAILEEIKRQEAELRDRRRNADADLAEARAAVAEADRAGHEAAECIGSLLDLLSPGLAHELRVAAVGLKSTTSRANELRRRIEQTEADLRDAANISAGTMRPEARALRIEALEASLARHRRELIETEAAHERAEQEHERLTTEAALLVGEPEGDR